MWGHLLSLLPLHRITLRFALVAIIPVLCLDPFITHVLTTHMSRTSSEAHQPCSNYAIVSGDFAPASDGFSTDPLAMGTVPMPVRAC